MRVSDTDPSASADAALDARVEADQDPGSRSVERLADAVYQHATAEAGALDAYVKIAATCGDPIVTLVMRLILEDEERHHGLLRRIGSTLRDAINWTHSPDALPSTRLPDQRIGPDLANLAKALIDEEQTGARALRDLARRYRGTDAGFDSLIFEMMAMDSDKHAHLLQFVARRLNARTVRDHGPLD